MALGEPQATSTGVKGISEYLAPTVGYPGFQHVKVFRVLEERLTMVVRRLSPTFDNRYLIITQAC